MMIFLKNKYIYVTFVIFFLGIILFVLCSNSMISFIFKDKIMIHRVNSIEKLNEVKNNFIGVELDVVYDSATSYFDINHPPAASIKLNLKEYLANSNELKSNVYWLDFKNLSKFNKDNALLELNSIVDKLAIGKNRIIVETTTPEFIKNIKDEGYLTSYYLPPHLHAKKEDSILFFISAINDNINKYPTDYISFNSNDYSIVKKNFPNLKKISWYTGNSSTIKKIPSKMKLYTILLDKNIDYLLLPYYSKTGNR
jgi:hypothetical protein